MTTSLLTLNAGSTSLKFANYSLANDGSDGPVLMSAGECPTSADADQSIVKAFDFLKPVGGFAAVGHRIVFGGPQHTGSCVASDDVLQGLEAFVSIDPLHLRPQLDLVYAARRRFPKAVQIVCFDTAFHRRSPSLARRLPLPNDIDPLIERYGFHGLSYEYICSKLPPESGRTVVAHLGAGASLCALNDSMPIDTTMGFSPLGGLMMSTRPGDLDPGVLLRLFANGYDVERLTDLLYRGSGLFAVSGGYAGMKEIVDRSPGDRASRDALELFLYQLQKHIGAMVAVLGGLDTLVFTGGIGENAAVVRARTCSKFGFLGLVVDERANVLSSRSISSPTSRVRTFVIPTDENLTIARHVTALLTAGRQS